MYRWVGVLGVAVLIGVVYAVSRDRGRVPWRDVARGLALQVALAALLLLVPGVKDVFASLAGGVQRFVEFSDAGARFLFGPLMDEAVPVERDGEAIGVARLGGIVILKILPTIIFVSAAMSVLFHLGILQRVVAVFAWVVRGVLRVSGAEALAATANVFMGMTEAPLMVRPYLPQMTRSELFAVMVGGFATISGSMMAVYSSLFGVSFADLLAASVLNAPAALYLTKIYRPETECPSTLDDVHVEFERDTVNVVDAAASGAGTGLKLALNVGAMLLAFVAGLAFVDAVLGWAGSFVLPEGEPLTLGRILGWLFLPAAWLLGAAPADCAEVGELLGTKLALNEYFAYEKLSTMELTPYSRILATYALCGFANFGSVAIQMGGIGGLVPGRRSEIARNGLRAMGLGAVANGITAVVAGLVLSVREGLGSA